MAEQPPAYSPDLPAPPGMEPAPPAYNTVEKKNESTELNIEDGSPSYQTNNAPSPPQYTDDPPPSYDSVMGRLEQMKDESEGNADFAKKLFCMACCGTIATIISVVICLALPIASICIGSIYLDDCPRERYIPIFLIVSGVFGVLRALSTSIHSIRNRDKEENEKKANPFDGLVGCFLFAWFIAGSVWVYRVHNDYQSDDPTQEDYCDKTLYLYAFWTLTVGYIFMALGICCACFCTGIMCCVGAKGKKEEQQ